MPLALTVLAAAIAAWDEQPIRLILDTGFEDALAPFTPHPGTPAITSEQAHSGKHSLRIERTGGVVLPAVDYAPQALPR